MLPGPGDRVQVGDPPQPHVVVDGQVQGSRHPEHAVQLVDVSAKVPS